MLSAGKCDKNSILRRGRRLIRPALSFLCLLLFFLLQVSLLCQGVFSLNAAAAEGRADSAVPSVSLNAAATEVGSGSAGLPASLNAAAAGVRAGNGGLSAALNAVAADIKADNPESSAAQTELLKDYSEYEKRFREIESLDDLEPKGYRVLEDQVFPVVLESFGEEEVTLVPAIEQTWKRLALFVADPGGRVLYKCNQLETNNSIRGRMLQCTREIAAVSFVDVNRDGLTDILLITKCVNDVGDYQGIPYKVGDVLFQGEKTFYRDWRISDKINRFGMNKSANCMISFVRDGESAEFLYTATTLEELLENGFAIEAEQNYTRNFEKLGRLQVVPGTMRISEYNFFMIYLVNEQGDIVWSLQPMGDYDSLYSLKGINGRDVDGDGLKDLVVLARYSREDAPGELKVETRCSIYYQRTSGFEVDTEFEKTYRCTEEDTMEEMIRKIREYWGWQIEE